MHITYERLRVDPYSSMRTCVVETEHRPHMGCSHICTTTTTTSQDWFLLVVYISRCHHLLLLPINYSTVYKLTLHPWSINKIAGLLSFCVRCWDRCNLPFLSFITYVCMYVCMYCTVLHYVLNNALCLCVYVSMFSVSMNVCIYVFYICAC
mgnify:CR=1 FL=1